LHRSTARLVSRRKEDSVLLERLKQLAAERPRFGYRRLTTLLRREGMLVNPKKVYRLCTKEGLLVRPKKRKPRTRSSFRPEVPALERPNQLWSLDFVEDALADGRKLRTLTIVDVYSRECPQIEVDTSLPGLRVVRVLEKLASRRQFPERLLVDNGPEFICRALAEWATKRGVLIAFTRPGKPTDKPHIESFNGRFRDECLNAHYFLSVPDARQIIEAWRFDYNHYRPHSALGGATPMEFLQQVDANQAPLSPERHQPVQ
jgi:putative transposase